MPYIKKKKKKIKIVGAAKEVLSEDTIRNFKKHKISLDVSTHPDYQKPKYSMKEENQKLIFTKGRDLLQFNIVVRPYIMRKHRLKDIMELDILLYLFPIQFFSIRDFKALPTSNQGYHLNTLIDMGFIEVVVHHSKGYGANIYGLTERAKKIVKEYYEYLSGEKTVNPNSPSNPFTNKDSLKVDEIRQKLLNKLTHQTKTQPKLYRKSFYAF